MCPLIVYDVVRVTANVYLRLFSGFRVVGAEHFPASGPLIVCSNHLRWGDPVVLACASRRYIYFMAKQELFESKLLGAVYGSLGAFPVRRGEVDRAAMRYSLGLLRGGKVLGMFPEGTRSRDGKLGPGEPGAAVLSLFTRAPVIPAGIRGYGPGRRLSVAWGRPIDPDDYGAAGAPRDKGAISAMTTEIMANIARLTDQAAPATPAAPPAPEHSA